MHNEKTWLEKLYYFLSYRPRSQKQLIDVLRDAHHHHLMNKDALQMIEGALAVYRKKVSDIMVPRPQMIVVDGGAHPLDVLPTIIHSQHSRFPVLEDARGKVVGILLAKDLLPFTLDTKKPLSFVRDLARPALFVPANKKLDVLLKEFRLNRNHMAIVADEYGGVAGLVTIEDVLEQIVGEIEDEYDTDDKEQAIKMLGKNTYWVNALTPIEDFNTYFKVNYSNANFDTIGGLLTQHCGHLPKRNEKIAFHDFEVLIIKATKRGIQMAQFKRKQKKEVSQPS
jgi:magnesium and cobalt transporter